MTKNYLHNLRNCHGDYDAMGDSFGARFERQIAFLIVEEIYR